jgi:hypothetical protein
LTQQNFGFEEMKLPTPISAGYIAAQQDALFGALKSGGKIAPASRLVGSVIESFGGLRARAHAGIQEKYRKNER